MVAMPHLSKNCHLCTKNKIFYTILHTTVYTALHCRQRFGIQILAFRPFKALSAALCYMLIVGRNCYIKGRVRIRPSSYKTIHIYIVHIRKLCLFQYQFFPPQLYSEIIKSYIGLFWNRSKVITDKLIQSWD